MFGGPDKEKEQSYAGEAETVVLIDSWPFMFSFHYILKFELDPTLSAKITDNTNWTRNTKVIRISFSEPKNASINNYSC